MPGRAHISFSVAIEVAMPACGLFIIDEAIAAPPIVVLAAGVGDMAAVDIALAVAITIFAIVEEVEVAPLAMPVMPAMLAISIFAVVRSRSRIDSMDSVLRDVRRTKSFYERASEPQWEPLNMQDMCNFR